MNQRKNKPVSRVPPCFLSQFLVWFPKDELLLGSVNETIPFLHRLLLVMVFIITTENDTRKRNYSLKHIIFITQDTMLQQGSSFVKLYSHRMKNVVSQGILDIIDGNIQKMGYSKVGNLP